MKSYVVQKDAKPKAIQQWETLTANASTNEDIPLNAHFNAHQRPPIFLSFSCTLFCIHILCIWLDPWILFHFQCDTLHKYISLAAASGAERLSGRPLSVPAITESNPQYYKGVPHKPEQPSLPLFFQEKLKEIPVPPHLRSSPCLGVRSKGKTTQRHTSPESRPQTGHDRKWSAFCSFIIIFTTTLKCHSYFIHEKSEAERY